MCEDEEQGNLHSTSFPLRFSCGCVMEAAAGQASFPGWAVSKHPRRASLEDRSSKSWPTVKKESL